MLIEFNATELANGDGPAFSTDWLTLSPGRAQIQGRPIGFPEVYLYHSSDLVIASQSITEVLDQLVLRNRSVTLSSFAISQFLHVGLVPPPHTEWEEVWFVGMGDTAILTEHPSGIELSWEREYSFMEENSTGEHEASTSQLLQLLTTSVDRQLRSVGGEGMLMMSSGKDSVSVAVALAEGNHRDVQCVTYRSEPANTENELASDICHRLGLKHRTIDLPVDPSTVEDLLVRFFEGSPRPCGDLAQIPYALAVGDSGLTTGAVFDGSGNDLYMGIVPSKNTQTKNRYRLRSDRLSRAVERVIPIDSPINYLTRSRIATAMPGRLFRPTDTRRFYPEVVGTGTWWTHLSNDTSEMSDIDLETAVVSIFQDQAGVHLKSFVAARAFGVESQLPFCDENLVDYFFHLPEADKYDSDTGVTKILLRKMLLETIGYDADTVGKHYFGFAGDQFLLEHKDFVLFEIGRCSLWSPEIKSLAASWLARLNRHPLMYHSLLVLFQLSGWHNHSRYLR